jgi:hypothetical protein
MLLQILRLCKLTFPDKWNVASSLKTILAVKHVTFKSRKKVGVKRVVNLS